VNALALIALLATGPTDLTTDITSDASGNWTYEIGVDGAYIAIAIEPMTAEQVAAYNACPRASLLVAKAVSK